MNIEFIQPYSFELKIGKAYNEAIERAEGWVCITDQDTLKPPGFAERVAEILRTHGNKETLYGCMTNRVGHNHPAIVQALFEEDSITKHLECAERLWEEHKTTLEDTRIIPGYCMVFHKDLARHFLPFPENTLTFDKIASRKSPQCKIMKGIYIIHLYRWGVKDPQKEQTHLHSIGHYLNK